MAGARGDLCVPLVYRIRSAHSPHRDPFHELGQVGPGGNAQGRLERSARPPAVSRILIVECQDHSGPFGEQAAAAVRDLPQLSHHGLDVSGSRLA